MRTWLVTGGAGFIGSHFIRHMLKADPTLHIVNLDKLTYAGSLDNVRDLADTDRYTFVRGDILDGTLVGDLLAKHRPARIVHFAAESHVDRSIAGPAVFVQTNVAGTGALLDCAVRARDAGNAALRFVQISTDEVYGATQTGRFTEQSPLAPRSPYSASKAAADMLVMAYHTTYGLPVGIVRMANNFGPCQHPEKLIPLTITRALAHQPIPLYGDGSQVRDWVGTADSVRAIQMVAQQGADGEIYNVGGDCELTNRALAERIIAYLHDAVDSAITEALITHVADRPGHDRRYAIDHTKLTQTLGWHPTLDFDTFLRYTIDWYVTHSKK